MLKVNMTSIHSKCLGFLGDVVNVALAMLKFISLTQKMEDNTIFFQNFDDNFPLSMA